MTKVFVEQPLASPGSANHLNPTLKTMKNETAYQSWELKNLSWTLEKLTWDTGKFKPPILPLLYDSNFGRIYL